MDKVGAGCALTDHGPWVSAMDGVRREVPND